MSVIISNRIRELLQQKDTLKVVASVDKEGIPHVTFKGTVNVNEEGQITFLEILESSQTNKNLTNSIWFEKIVAITILGADKTSYQIKGIPKRAIISGPLFEEAYVRVQEKFGDVDLSTIWVIDPIEIKEETFKARLEEERKLFPIIGHLDRFAK
jgi:hypothetical protein